MNTRENLLRPRPLFPWAAREGGDWYGRPGALAKASRPCIEKPDWGLHAGACRRSS